MQLLSGVPPERVAQVVRKVSAVFAPDTFPGRSCLLAGGGSIDQRIAATWLTVKLLQPDIPDDGVFGPQADMRILEGRHVDLSMIDGYRRYPDRGVMACITGISCINMANAFASRLRSIMTGRT